MANPLGWLKAAAVAGTPSPENVMFPLPANVVTIPCDCAGHAFKSTHTAETAIRQVLLCPVWHISSVAFQMFRSRIFISLPLAARALGRKDGPPSCWHGLPQPAVPDCSPA